MNRRTIVSALAGAVLAAASVGALAFAPAAAAAADTQPPTVPTNVVAANVTPAQVTLVWGASTDDVGVSGYDIFRATGSSTTFTPVGTATGASFTDTGLSSSTLYRYQVRARDAAGNVSAFSPAAFAVTPGPCTTPPPAPTNLRILAFSPASVSLRWTIVVPSFGCSPAGFDVLRAPGASGGTFTQLAQTGLTDTFVDSTVAPNSTYRYQVRARSGGLVSGPSNTVQITTPDGCTPPLPMGSLTVTAVTASSVSLTWAGPTNPACFAYDILRAPATGDGTFTQVGTTTGLSFTNTGLPPGTAYRYVVQGRVIPNSTPWGTTNVALATTTQGCPLIPPPAPGNLTAADPATTSVTLTWAVTAAPGCSFSYEILRAPGASGATFTQVGTATGNSFTDTGLTPNTTYRYQARTRDAAGNLSPVSNTVTVTTDENTTGCTATYRTVTTWDGAFQGEVTVTNTSANPTDGWQVTLTVPSTARITQIWGGRTDQTASPYTITNEAWNGTLQPNASTTAGFHAMTNSPATATVSCTTGSP